MVELEYSGVRMPVHELQIVRCHQNGHPDCIDLPEQVHDTASGPVVEIACGLVRQEKERLAREGSGDGDALLLAPRELMNPRSRFWCEAHLTEKPLGSRENLLLRGTDDLEGEGDVLESGAAGKETKILKYVTHLSAELPYVSARGSRGRESAHTYLSIARPLG